MSELEADSNTVGMAGYQRDSCSAYGGSSASAARCCSRASSTPDEPTTEPEETRSVSSSRSRGPGSGGLRLIRSLSAVPSASRCRTAHLRPPRPGLPTDRLATGTRSPSSKEEDEEEGEVEGEEEGEEERATSL